MKTFRGFCHIVKLLSIISGICFAITGIFETSALPIATILYSLAVFTYIIEKLTI